MGGGEDGKGKEPRMGKSIWKTTQVEEDHVISVVQAHTEHPYALSLQKNKLAVLAYGYLI